MDEPFSSLDALTREHLQTTVLSLWQRRRPTCVLVTHNVPEAVFLGKCRGINIDLRIREKLRRHLSGLLGIEWKTGQ